MKFSTAFLAACLAMTGSQEVEGFGRPPAKMMGGRLSRFHDMDEDNLGWGRRLRGERRRLPPVPCWIMNRCNRDEDADSLGNRWAFGGSTPSYSYGGNTYNSGGYIANPSRSAIERANNAGALTRSEYNRLTNRDEDADSLGLGRRWGRPIRIQPNVRI